MKKIITLLLGTVLITSAIAQTANHQPHNGYDNNSRKYNNPGYQNSRNRILERDRLIRRINETYDFRIQQVNYNRSLNRREKKRIIKDLMAKRSMEINRVYSRFNYANVYNDNSNRDRIYR